MDDKDTYCVLSHSSIAIQNNADFCCCNINRESWKTNQHEVMFVPTHPVKESWNSYTRKMIATSLDHGIRHSSCQACWDHEDSGNESARQRFNTIFKDLEPDDNQPRILIIKPGNTCNLSCRMCNPATSSAWYSDAYKLEQPNMTFNEYTRTFEVIRNSFNKKNDEFWGTLREWLPKMHFIDIYGGEPFLTPGMFDLLAYGVATGVSKNISLQLSTNATIDNIEYLDILSQYKSVKINLSIDSYDAEQNEYIRYPSKNSEVIENAFKFKEYLLNHNNVILGITHTINSLNVFYVDRSFDYLKKTFGVPVAENYVVNSEYDIRHLPVPVKHLLQKTLTTTSTVNFLKTTIPHCDIEWPKFCRVTNQLDKIRNQSFADVFPEWWEILKSHWVK